MSNTLEGDTHVNGVLSARTFNPPNASITRDDQVATQSDPIDTGKLQHRFIKTEALTDHATDSAVVRRVVHVVKGATGSIVSFTAGVTVAATATGVCAVNLYVNGTTVLSGTIDLDSANAAFSQEAGTVTDPDLVAGDVVEIGIDSTSGANKPKGVNATVVIDEMP
jgi:hypothetical protein